MAQLSIPVPQPPPPTRVRLVHEVEARDHLFLLDDDERPEKPLRHEAILLLDPLLRAWAARSGRDVLVAHNLACRLDPADARIGVDPDLCLIEPPADLDTLGQPRLWEEHAPPNDGGRRPRLAGDAQGGPRGGLPSSRPPRGPCEPRASGSGPSAIGSEPRPSARRARRWRPS